MSTPAIQIQNLTKRYGAITAVDALDLRVQEGEFFGLLGPNGAGKTTTINILSGLCNKTSGDVQIFGHDLVQEYRACRRLIGLVPQEFNFDQWVKLRNMLYFQGGYYGIPRAERLARAHQLLIDFDLHDRSDTILRLLSGGMKRRAIIVRALIHQPRLLILDEPTAGVDVELRKTLWAYLRRLKQEGVTILLTTHYIEEAEALCDRIAIMDQGRIVAMDTTRGLVNQLNRESISITAVHPISPQTLAQLSDLSPVLDQDGHELTLSFEKGTVNYHRTLQRLFETDMTIASVKPLQNRLEQIFIQMTSKEK